MGLSGFLKTIQEIKRHEVAKRRRQRPLASLRRQAEQLPAAADFQKALKKSGPSNVGIIAEIKKASPAKGDICVDLDAGATAAEFEKAGARAVSVLTEPVYFKGCLADLKAASTATYLPVLRKDFVIHEYQIYETKSAGASTLLLITTLLSRDQQAEFTSLARDLDMEPLVEISSEWEIEQALITGARVVGINNQNLATLGMDPEAAMRIAPVLPDEILPVAASGITGRQDIRKAIDAGVHNFLVGESIVRSRNRQSFIRSLMQDT